MAAATQISAEANVDRNALIAATRAELAAHLLPNAKVELLPSDDEIAHALDLVTGRTDTPATYTDGDSTYVIVEFRPHILAAVESHSLYSKCGGARGELFYLLRNLAQLRQWACISQYELAIFASKACGRDVWPRTIGALERLERGARERTLLALAVALGVGFTDLYRPLSDEDCAALRYDLGGRFPHC